LRVFNSSNEISFLPPTNKVHKSYKETLEEEISLHLKPLSFREKSSLFGVEASINSAVTTPGMSYRFLIGKELHEGIKKVSSEYIRLCSA
jgi:hypothetical protein